MDSQLAKYVFAVATDTGSGSARGAIKITGTAFAASSKAKVESVTETKVKRPFMFKDVYPEDCSDGTSEVVKGRSLFA